MRIILHTIEGFSQETSQIHNRQGVAARPQNLLAQNDDKNTPCDALVCHKKILTPAHTKQTLAQAIWMSDDLTPPPLCSGLGRCRRCKVRFISPAPSPLAIEDALLSQDDLTQGWRLACRHVLENLPDHLEIALPEPIQLPQTSRQTALAKEHSLKNNLAPLRLAVDLGTTSLQWQAFDLKEENNYEGQQINPQMGAGSEVMSRLAMASCNDGLAQLTKLTLKALHQIVNALPAPVEEICLAANTVMTAITLQADIQSLAHAPYKVPFQGDSTVHLSGLPPIYIPPQPAPFVGGDLSAGLAYVLHDIKPTFPFLLADLGTNGEFVLGLAPDQYFLASVPLGPALEGIGLTFGGMAAPNSITGYTLTPRGLKPQTFSKDTENAEQTVPMPTCICGTGYLSLIHALLRAGILHRDGTFCKTPALPLGRNLAKNIYTFYGEARLTLSDGLYLTASDVEEILKVKAAFSLALEHLLKAASLTPASLNHIYLCGALGSHVPHADLEALGFVPQGSGERIKALGNTSLYGARCLLLHPETRDSLAHLSTHCRVLDLTQSPDFTQQFLRHMRFE